MHYVEQHITFETDISVLQSNCTAYFNPLTPNDL
jgi:hypothetical protein